MNKEFTRLRDELLEGRCVISFTSGVSMEPLLHDKRKKNATHVLIEPVKGVCNVGDMPLAQMSDGRYVLHRIIRVDRKQEGVFYVTRGDNCIGCEYVPQESILGVVSEIYYKQRTVKVTDSGYQKYVKIWMMLFPLRKFLKRCRNLFFRIMNQGMKKLLHIGRRL